MKKKRKRNLDVAFTVLEAGSGPYAKYMEPYIGRTFANADELIELLLAAGADEGCRHLFDLDKLRKDGMMQ